MACCLTAPIHYLNQCWFTISNVHRQSFEYNFTGDNSAINHWNYRGNFLFKISLNHPRGQWVNLVYLLGFFSASYHGKLCIKWCNYHQPYINSLGPGKFKWNFRHVIFKQIVVIGGWGISCKITLIWMSLVFTDDQSTLVHVMAWCRQATSHYLSQCWPRSLSPYGVTRPQWVNNVDNITNAYIYLAITWYGSSWWRPLKLWYPLGMFS